MSVTYTPWTCRDMRWTRYIAYLVFCTILFCWTHAHTAWTHTAHVQRLQRKIVACSCSRKVPYLIKYIFAFMIQMLWKRKNKRNVICPFEFKQSCWRIGPSTISSENQLVSKEGSQSLLWHSNRTPQYLLVVHVGRATMLHPSTRFFFFTWRYKEAIAIARNTKHTKCTN